MAAETKSNATAPPDIDTSDIEAHTVTVTTPTEPKTAGLSDNSNVPRLSYLRVFWFFFSTFGCFAWGGPVAQIALIKERLVIQDKWITLERFQRVFAVYQILPGPEAAELCMFFGCLCAGKVGGIIAGIAFMLPGFILMLVASYLYSLAGFENKYFNASFRAVQPIVGAMVIVSSPAKRICKANTPTKQIFRATHKIAEHTLIEHKTRKINPFLVIAAICTAINSALRINM